MSPSITPRTREDERIAVDAFGLCSKELFLRWLDHELDRYHE